MERHPKQLVDCVYGPSDLFAYEVEKVIISINTTDKTFTWLSRTEIMKSLDLIRPDDFVDALVLSGSDELSAFPPMERNAKGSFVSAVEAMKRFKLGSAVIKSIQDNPTTSRDPALRDPSYIDKFKKMRASHKFGMVFLEEGTVNPLDSKNCPNDMQDIFGERLPDEMHYYLLRGAVGPQVFEWLLYGQAVDLQPLDGGESEEYRKFVENLFKIRNDTLGLFTDKLNRYFISRHVKAVSWHNRTGNDLDYRALQPIPYEATNQWNATDSVIKSAASESTVSESRLKILKAHKYAASLPEHQLCHQCSYHS